MTDSALDLLVDAAAVYRLTVLVIDDRIAEKPREAFLDRHDPVNSYAGYLVTCAWCTSFWVGAGAVVASRLLPRVWRPVARALAFSAVSGLIAERSQ